MQRYKDTGEAVFDCDCNKCLAKCKAVEESPESVSTLSVVGDSAVSPPDEISPESLPTETYETTEEPETPEKSKSQTMMES